MRSLREGPARGQALVAVASVAFLVVAMTWLDRVGPKEPSPIEVGSAPSGMWICPHGGGPNLSVALFLANPGTGRVTARVTQLGARAPSPPTDLDVSPGSTVRVNLESEDRGGSTAVEFFGGWIAAGWVSFTDEGVAGTVFLSTEYDPGWELEGTSRRPDVAFGWATSFRAEGEPIRVRHGGSVPARIQAVLLVMIWLGALWATRRPVAR